MNGQEVQDFVRENQTPGEIREAMQAEYEHARRVMADRATLDALTRVRFVRKCAERVRSMMNDPLAINSKKTTGEGQRLLWAFCDLVSDPGYSGARQAMQAREQIQEMRGRLV